MGVAIRPEKPTSDFPLFPHANGCWAKKIAGKLHFFGSWKTGTPEAALEEFRRQRGRRTTPVVGVVPQSGKTSSDAGATVADAVNTFLNAKRKLVEVGELSERTFFDYKATGLQLANHFGRDRELINLRPEDFDGLRVFLSKGRGPVALGNEVAKTRIILNSAFSRDLIEKPIKYGPDFNKPSRKTLRAAREKKGERMFQADQIRQLLGIASVQLRAMILLGINAGLGNHDVGLLPIAAANLKTAWLNYPRVKTAIKRNVPLWPETVRAIQDAIAIRPKPKDPGDAGLMFLTRTGRRWIHVNSQTGTWVDSIIMELRKLLITLDLKRPGLSFYALRHTFETIGGDSRDQIAVDAIMGHAADSGDMSATYREKIFEDRLHGVVDHVRKWLWPAGSEAEQLKADELAREQAAKAEKEADPHGLNNPPKPPGANKKRHKKD